MDMNMNVFQGAGAAPHAFRRIPLQRAVVAASEFAAATSARSRDDGALHHGGGSVDGGGGRGRSCRVARGAGGGNGEWNTPRFKLLQQLQGCVILTEIV